MNMNLEIVFKMIRNSWKQIVLIVLLATISTAVLLFIKKPYYRSSAIFTAANPNIGDRSNIYRTEFWEQYFYFGGEFDNDRLMAISKAEEMNRFMVDTFQLIKHYKINPNSERAQYFADYEYKENVKIQKNEYGHVKVNVWDTDKKLAAVMANTIVKKVNEKSVASLNNMKNEILQKLKNDFNSQKDTLQQIEKSLLTNTNSFLTARKSEIINDLNEKEKLIQQFNTSINNVSALFVIENALPALKKDKPQILSGIILAAILSFIFSVLLLLIIEWKRNVKLS
jgi:Chain length determinant protein